MTKYLDIYSDLIKLAAQMAKGEGVPDWSERVFSTGTPSYERRDMLSALRMADEAGITHALQLRAIADRLSAEMRSSNEPCDQHAAKQDLAYYEGARAAAAMAHQSLSVMDKWINGGCGGRWQEAKAAQGASRDASPADLVGALQDVVHTDPGPVRAGKAHRDESSGDSILDHKVTVCSACLCAGCWQGSFYCEDYKSAQTVEKTVRELAQGNARESADFWFRDVNTGKVDEEKLARFHRSQRTSE